MIGSMARFGRGLPAQVLRFQANEVTQVGLDFLAAAFAYGAEQVVFLANPKKRDELGGLAGQIGLAERSEEHTSELQSLMRISYAVFCLKKKNKNNHKDDNSDTHTQNEYTKHSRKHNTDIKAITPTLTKLISHHHN